MFESQALRSTRPHKMDHKFTFICITILAAFSKLSLSDCSPLSASPLPLHTPKVNGEFEALDQHGKYLLDYRVTNSSIVFSVLVETTGFVGFGLSTNGGMAGADMIIGGVHPNGTKYFDDRHGTGPSLPPVDQVQDWHLLAGWENGTHTFLSFYRLLDTCDKEQDLPITRDTVSLIWSYGATDTISYHGENRGVSAATLLDPPMPPFEPEKYQSWRMTVDHEMPADATTYYCTTQRSPLLGGKRHIIAFRPYLVGEDAVKHTHHFIVHKCRAPSGQNPDVYFKPYLDGPGGDCYVGPTTGNVPMRDCRSYLYVWAIGGKTMVFPDHVGYPIGENGPYDYYLLEIHYDNPQKVEGKKFETGLEIYYTDELRPNEAGTLTLGHRESYALTIPPNVTDFIVSGHCAPQCSNQIPAPGINVFNILLHSHLAGRKLKIRHFRNNVEIPWLAVDNNYDFDYQQNRPLNPEGRILPGDHLTYECTYDSTVAKSTIIGGLASEEEMCNTFLLYYPRMPLESCQSEFPQRAMLDTFGIGNVFWDSIGDPIILSPANLAGKTYTEVLNTMVSWTPEFLAEFQEKIRFGEHNNRCQSWPILESEKEPVRNADPRVSYPIVDEEYSPPDRCANVKSVD